MSNKLTPRAFRPAVIVAVVLGGVIRSLILLRSTTKIDHAFVLDDTYYTLTIARSLADGHGPSASANTMTSGFQPLIAFILVPFYRLITGIETQFRLAIALSLFADVAIIAVVALLVRRLFGPLAGLIAAFLWAMSPTAIRYGAAGLETSLALLMELLFVFVWLTHGNSYKSRKRAILVGVVGALAILARVDALPLVVILFAIQLLWSKRAAIQMSLACAFTLAPWWIWCTAMFGSPLPQSGFHLLDRGWSGTSASQMMAISGANVLLGPLTTASPLQGHWYAHKTLWPFFLVLAIYLITGLKLALQAYKYFRADQIDTLILRKLVAKTALLFFCVAIVGFYTWFPVRWFTYRYLAPAVLITTIFMARGLDLSVQTLKKHAPKTANVSTLAMACGLLLIVTPQLVRIASLSTPISAGLWSHPSATVYFDSDTGWSRNATRVSRVLPKGATIGAQQSGALGWFTLARSQRVVNLDGVVNPHVTGFRNAREICSEIRRQHVEFIADFASFGAWISTACRPFGVEVEENQRQVHNADRHLKIQRLEFRVLRSNS